MAVATERTGRTVMWEFWEFIQTNMTVIVLSVLLACPVMLAFGHGRNDRHGPRLQEPKRR